MAALFRMERSNPAGSIESVGRAAVESLLVVTIGVLFGRLAWAVLSPPEAQPLPPQTSSLTENTSARDSATFILAQINPFAADVQSAAGSETRLDLKLSGVRAVEGNTTASSAVITFPDGAQKRFVPGDEVMPGVVLVNVTAEGAHLSREGTLEVLSLNPGRSVPFMAPDAQAAAPRAIVMASGPQPVTPSALAADTVMTPELRSGRVSGYRLAPRGSGAFEAAGLESGDLILRVNGEAIEGLHPDQISQSVTSGADVALDVVRQGAIIRLRVSPNASLSQ